MKLPLDDLVLIRILELSETPWRLAACCKKLKDLWWNHPSVRANWVLRSQPDTRSALERAALNLNDPEVVSNLIHRFKESYSQTWASHLFLDLCIAILPSGSHLNLYEKRQVIILRVLGLVDPKMDISLYLRALICLPEKTNQLHSLIIEPDRTVTVLGASLFFCSIRGYTECTFEILSKMKNEKTFGNREVVLALKGAKSCHQEETMKLILDFYPQSSGYL
jgi:hypothetical protein